ncbi:MAG: hypothetical protein JF607_04840 [Burkholderiales bacterium]|jgi:hypothetical protein|nr:hypothetical protein [Burkholderiales bacterium]
MSFKTDRLVALFPEAYAAREGASLLHTVLDALGAELMAGDATVKKLLKSHWIDYAEGGGLDGLAALLGVTRRLLPNGQPERDDTFRPLVRATVSSFQGGGTVEGIKGAVRAALGLPYDLTLFGQQLARNSANTAAIDTLIARLTALVKVEEFAPKLDVMLGSAAPTAAGSEVTLNLAISTIDATPPRIEWSFTSNARGLSLTQLDSGEGVVAEPDFILPHGATLLLEGSTAADFSASIGPVDVSSHFTSIGGGAPRLPLVPPGVSRWSFAAAHGGVFDQSNFDADENFDASAFSVRMQWLRLQPLVFDVIVPFFTDAAVARAVAGSGYGNRFKIFQGLSHDAMQKVVDRARAAGVRGMVQYAISLPGESSEARPWDDQAALETFSGRLDHAITETQDAEESLTAGALDSEVEIHDSSERFVIGGVFNVAVFDGAFGFQ